MERQALTDGSGRWIDLDAAERFEEGTRWDGSNFIGLATGSQWDHQDLYRSGGGQWVLSAWSQRQGTAPTWVEIDDTAAAAWLATNEHESHEACAGEYAELEI